MTIRPPTPGCVQKTLALLGFCAALIIVATATITHVWQGWRERGRTLDQVAASIALAGLADMQTRPLNPANADANAESSAAGIRSITLRRWDPATERLGDPTGLDLLRSASLRAPRVDVRVAQPANGLNSRGAWREVDVAMEADRGWIIASCLVALDAGEVGLWGDVWPFLAPVAAVASLSVLIAWWCVHHDVLQPLATLNEVVSAPSFLNLADNGVVDRSDVLGEIARGIKDLQRDATDWRQRAERVQRQVEHQVAERTRAITRELAAVRRALWEDPLTGVKNRRLFEERFAEIFAAQSDAAGDLSVVLFDVDRFKQLNDRLGHAAGDRVLKFVGTLLRQCVREDDLAIRIGGDEFLLVLPGVPADKAHALAARISALFGQYASIVRSLPFKPGLSFGVASIRNDHPTDAAALIESADRRMYAAKGRRAARTEKVAVPA